MDYKFTSATTPDLLSQLHTVNQPTENSDRLKGGSLEMEAEVLSLPVYEKPPPPQRGKKAMSQCHYSPYHSFKQVMDNKVWLGYHNKQGHMGPAKLQEKERNSTYQVYCQNSFKQQ